MRDIAVLDIETNMLLNQSLDYSEFPYKLNKDAKLWTVVIRDYYTDDTFVAENEAITKEWMRSTLSKYDVIVTHNGIKFDLLMLRLFGVLEYTIGWWDEDDTLFGKKVKLIDTLILSRLFDPGRYEGHSLKSWGSRLGNYKDDYREQCIMQGYISKSSNKGAEFLVFNPLIKPYCIQDTSVTKDVFSDLLKEWNKYKDWNNAIKQEHILANLSIRREIFGFSFDKELALKCVTDLEDKMQSIRTSINPILPEKDLNKGETSYYTPPVNQFTKNKVPSSAIQNFVKKLNGKFKLDGWDYVAEIEGKDYKLPIKEPIKTKGIADIDDLDHVKETLINIYDWEPTEWRERDLTKDAKKQNISYEKRLIAAKRWIEETRNGKYKKQRLEYLDCLDSELEDFIIPRLNDNKPVRVPTSPCIRVGVEKNLCPNLIKLGEKVSFAKDIADYLTYKHRKSCIAGGKIEEIDLDFEVPSTGYLSSYREQDGRIPTPSIEIGAVSNRYRHISVANIPRITSLYGKEMRSLFCSGDDFLFLGFDFASLEARVMGHYAYNYPNGKEMADMLLSEKPNDWHSVTAKRLGIPRGDCKSVNYGLIYGSQPVKVGKMLRVPLDKAKEIYEGAWAAMPALAALRDDVADRWEKEGKAFIKSIDGRKIITRSKHSLLNFLFQSSGVIIAKYSTIFLFEYLEKQGLCIDPFQKKPDVLSMIEYHDEVDLAINKNLINYEVFDTKEDAEVFISEWTGKYQLSSIRRTNNGKFFVCTPGKVSIAIQEGIQRAETLLKTNLDFGMEWIVGKNWAECH